MKRSINKHVRKAILTNDPSITAWGWAVVSMSGEVLEGGCIKTSSESKVRRIRKGDDRVRRISEINCKLLELIRTYKIVLILSELPHGSQSAVSAVMIGIVTGIIQTLGDSANIPVEWYSEADAKKSVLNKRSATKIEMIDAIKRLYPHTFTGVQYKDEAVADALAVYHVAAQTSPLVKMLKANEIRRWLNAESE